MGIVNQTQREAELDAEIKALEGEVAGTPVTEVTVPEKYKGKSLDEVIEMHQVTERNLSRLGQEVGTLRKAVLERPIEKTPPKEVKVDDLLDNPQGTIEELVTRSPVVKKLNDQLEQFESNQQKKQFETTYPEYRKDVDNPEFIKWIQKSPLRGALAQAADQLDFVAANELWLQWDERQSLVKQAEDDKKAQVEAKRKTDLKKGTLESGSGNGTENKKIWRRSEIIDIKARALMGDRKAMDIVQDPQWQRDTLQAYSDKRAR